MILEGQAGLQATSCRKDQKLCTVGLFKSLESPFYSPLDKDQRANESPEHAHEDERVRARAGRRQDTTLRLERTATPHFYILYDQERHADRKAAVSSTNIQIRTEC